MTGSVTNALLVQCFLNCFCLAVEHANVRQRDQSETEPGVPFQLQNAAVGIMHTVVSPPQPSRAPSINSSSPAPLLVTGV